MIPNTISNNMASVVPLHLPKNATLYCESFPAEGAYILCKGSIKLVTLAGSCEERIVSILPPRRMFGFDCLLASGVRSWSAIAREECVGFYFPSEPLSRILRSDPQLLWNTFLSLIETMHRINREKLLISGSRVGERLEKVVDAFAKYGMAALKQREIAEVLGVSEETVSRTLAHRHQRRDRQNTSEFPPRPFPNWECGQKINFPFLDNCQLTFHSMA